MRLEGLIPFRPLLFLRKGDFTMADYQKMYSKLFNATTDAVKILQAAQAETEEMYIGHEADNITLLKPNDDDGGDD